MKTLAIVAAVAVAALTACSGSKEEQLVDARRERRVILDQLYTEYGGGKLASEVRKEADRGAAEIAREPAKEGKDAAIEFMKMVGNAAGEVDRTAFEYQCETLGQGQRPMIMNDRAKAFFSSAATEKSCLKVVQLGRKITMLEKELGVPPQQ